MTRPAYIVVNIGGIQIDDPTSNIVGVYNSRKAADVIVARLLKTHKWSEDGLNYFEIFPMPTVDATHSDYIETGFDE